MTRSSHVRATLGVAALGLFLVNLPFPGFLRSAAEGRMDPDETPPTHTSAPASATITAGTPTSSPSIEPPEIVSATAAPPEASPTDPPITGTVDADSPGPSPGATLPTGTMLFEDPSTTPSPSVTPSPSPTLSPTSLPLPTSSTPGSILINEIAWAGTLASAHDEWIELHNPFSSPVLIDGWILTDGGDLRVDLRGRIEPFGYFLLERTDDSTIADLAADVIYTGSLHNGGEQLRLTDAAGTLIDSANLDGGPWPAGDSSSRASMERVGGADQSGNWRSFTGYGGNGHDTAGGPIQGTPGQPNSIFFATPTSVALPTPSATPSATPSLMPSAAPAGSVIINEVAWAGTLASASDEWIELYNPGEQPLELLGWTLTDGGDILVELEGSLAPGGYFLLERTDDSTIVNITADVLYSGSLSNFGEVINLYDPAGNLVDWAAASGGGWPAGDSASRASMERLGGSWGTFTGYYGNGTDASGQPIPGTPRQPNSLLFPTPQPTWIPGKLVINEVLIRPHFDWQGTGGVDTGDEFIEILNLGPGPVNLRGFVLDDLPEAGSSPYELRSAVLEPGSYRAIFRSRTHIALNDGGDVVRLQAPDGRLIDEISYLRVRAYNLSFGRFPDGSGHLRYGLWPTPGQPNLPFDENPPSPTMLFSCLRPGSDRLGRLAHVPGMSARLRRLGFTTCSHVEAPHDSLRVQ